MDWFEDEVRNLEGAARFVPSCLPLVAFYGSSSIRLWTTLAEDFPDFEAVNLGFGGSTLAACAHFFRRIVVPRRPDGLLIYAGDNDLGDGRGAADVLQSLHELLAQAERSLGPIPIAFLSVKPSPARWHLDEAIRRTNAAARDVMAKRPTYRFIDIYPRMLGDDARPRRELYQADGLHLSDPGYRLWTEVISEHCGFFLDSSRESP